MNKKKDAIGNPLTFYYGVVCNKTISVLIKLFDIHYSNGEMPYLYFHRDWRISS